MTEKPGIYAIRHLESGKVYVGSASNISKRWSRHRKELHAGTHKNKHLQAAWNKYGEEAFVFEVLELTIELDAREQFWIDKTGCLNADKGYNYCPIARSTRGVKLGPRPQWVRDKLSRGLKGKCGSGVTSPVFRGEMHGLAKFTEDQIREIRRRYGEPTPKGKGRSKKSVSYRQLAEEYGVVPSVICEIVWRKTWSHVE